MHWPFIWKMAWRDSRSSRRRLLVFSISITLDPDVAALTERTIRLRNGEAV